METSRKKLLSLIQLERGMQLMPRIKEEGVATEMVATYLSTPTTLRKAKTDPSALNAALEQADELQGEEAAQLVADFFSQVGKYNESILGFLEVPQAMKDKVTATIKAALPS